MPDLYARLLVAVTARQQRAQAATPGPWFAATDYPQMVAPERMAERHGVAGITDEDTWLISTSLTHHPVEDAVFVAAEDPATVLRHCTEDLYLLNLHSPDADGYCKVDRYGYVVVKWPCTTAQSFIRRYDTEEQP